MSKQRFEKTDNNKLTIHSRNAAKPPGLVRNIALSFAQLSDKNIRKIVFKSILITAALYVAFIILSISGVGAIDFESDLWKYLSYFGALMSIVLVLIFFPFVSVIVSSFFLEDVARAVEQKHYNYLGEPKSQPILEAFRTALSFIVVSLILNLLALPFYLIPGLNIAVGILLNGYLIGREFFEIVFLRRADSQEAKSFRKNNKKGIIAAGVLIYFSLTVPIINMIAPILGIIFMVHHIEMLKNKNKH